MVGQVAGFGSQSSALIDIVKLVMAKEIVIMLTSAMAIGGVTYGVLMLFMKPELRFGYTKQIMTKEEKRIFTGALWTSLWTLGVLVPIIISIVPVFTKSLSPVLESLKGGLIGMIIAGTMVIICSYRLKRAIRAGDDKHKQHDSKKLIMVPECFMLVLDIGGAYIAGWITRTLMGIINLGIRILHKPFIMEYAIVATILNLIFSFTLVGILGVSKDAGAWNLIGSIIGQTAHYIFNRKGINKLKDEYKRSAAC